VVRVTTSEVPRALRKAGSVTTTRRLSNDPPNGSNVGSVDWSTTLGRNAELSIQYTGKPQMAARASASTLSPVRASGERGFTTPPS
jgi:hypothetical protein